MENYQKVLVVAGAYIVFYSSGFKRPGSVKYAKYLTENNIKDCGFSL